VEDVEGRRGSGMKIKKLKSLFFLFFHFFQYNSKSLSMLNSNHSITGFSAVCLLAYIDVGFCLYKYKEK